MGVLTWSRGSIGFVGEVFEVMTQVDLGLTSVSRFDSADSVISGNNANQKPGRHKQLWKDSNLHSYAIQPKILHRQVPNGGGELTAGDVDPELANKWHARAIGLTCD
jgi:hypothetical protein